jgi:ribosome maturation factor RimP
MLKKLAEYLGREVEVWTTENTEPWMGILKEANADYILLLIDELSTFLVTNKIVAFRLSEGEQGNPEEEEHEHGEED